MGDDRGQLLLPYMVVLSVITLIFSVVYFSATVGVNKAIQAYARNDLNHREVQKYLDKKETQHWAWLVQPELEELDSFLGYRARFEDAVTKDDRLDVSYINNYKQVAEDYRSKDIRRFIEPIEENVLGVQEDVRAWVGRKDEILSYPKDLKTEEDWCDFLESYQGMKAIENKLSDRVQFSKETVINSTLLGHAKGLYRYVDGLGEDLDPHLLALILEDRYLGDELRSTQYDTRKVVALTFDDGPNEAVTPQVVQTLLEKEVPATFFMVGGALKAWPETARLVYEGGFEIGNHTYTHPDLSQEDDVRVKEEIESTTELIESLFDLEVNYFRKPYGAGGERVSNLTDLEAVGWNVDSLDWELLDAQKILETVQTSIQDQSIIILHDVHETTAQVLPELIDWLKNEGYRFVDLEDIGYFYDEDY